MKRFLPVFVFVCAALVSLAWLHAAEPKRGKRAGYDWWSLQKPQRPVVPAVDVDAVRTPGWDRNPIDAFVLRRLRDAGLEPSSEAERRVLIRRVTQDLIGLPPKPEEVEAFVGDKAPKAYERLVDQLLESPHYGERWARHWMDVVGFGETHGFEYNQPRNNAWPYKNWLIDAFNRDLPYDEFVRQQLAGDVLKKHGEGIVATGFLVAGPHNTTMPSNDKMRKTMRQDEMEGMVAMVSQTFLGLTSNCGRCHDHKFDPISQKDYYRLVAALSGVKHGERDYATEEVARARGKLERIRTLEAELEAKLAALDGPARQAILAARRENQQAPSGTTKNSTAPGAAVRTPRPIASWNFDGNLRDGIGKLHARTERGARLQDGALLVDGKGFARSAPLERDVREKTLEAWVRLANLGQRGGAAISLQTKGGSVFDAIVFGEREPQRWMAGSNGFVRTKSFSAPAETDADGPVHVAIVYAGDGTITGYRNGKPYGTAYKTGGPVTYKAGECEVVFGLRHSPPGGNHMLSGAILKAQLYDRALAPEEVAASAANGPRGVSEEDIVTRLSPDQRRERERLKKERERLAQERSDLQKTKAAKTYACVPGKPPEVRLLARGDVYAPQEVVFPGGVAALRSTSWDFGLQSNASDAERRTKLAEWITHPENPLFARVIANRLWHYHFGAGIVATPNDFGFNGARPSHPQLLDWLATEIEARGWSLKAMHRLMVTSATYRQSSRPRSTALRVDADNRLLWRASPRRLEAESIRDAMLSVAGLLNPKVGGPGYRDVRHYQYRGSNFYDPIPQNGPEFYRRTIYRFHPRGARRTILDTFDCPDPSATTPRRAVTTTPLQALALMNNTFVLHLASEFAERLEREARGDASRQVKRAYALAYGREASAGEVAIAVSFIRDHGLPAFCRVVFNTNEFLFVQ